MNQSGVSNFSRAGPGNQQKKMVQQQVHQSDMQEMYILQ